MVPGAVNNARWMARAIYALKSFLFRYEINFGDDVVDKLRRFSFFISAIYVKYWNWSTNAFNAPVNDLQFLKDLEDYRNIDRELADVAIVAFTRHLTYLSDENILLSLFSNIISSEQKEAIRLRLVRTIGTRTENSNRCMRQDSFSTCELQDFVSPRSMFLFLALKIDVPFIEHSATEWDNLESYKNARIRLKNLLVVVNDSAQRALGQTSNFIHHQKARTEINLQNLLNSKVKK